MSPWRRRDLETEQLRLQTVHDDSLAAAARLLDRFGSLRDQGIRRFIPLLMQTVTKYNHAFEAVIEVSGEEVLERICALCASIKHKGNTFRQLLPSAHPPESLHTLLLLMQQAMQANEKLQALAKEACASVPDTSFTVG